MSERTPYPKYQACPCGSGQKYKFCCFTKGFHYYLDDDDEVEVARDVPMTKEVSELLVQHRANLEKKLGEAGHTTNGATWRDKFARLSRLRDFANAAELAAEVFGDVRAQNVAHTAYGDAEDALRRLTEEHLPEIEADYDEISAALDAGRPVRPDDPVFPELAALSEEDVKKKMIGDFQKLGIRPVLIYAFEKTGLMVTEQNKRLIPDVDLAAWDAAVEEYYELHPEEDSRVS